MICADIPAIVVESSPTTSPTLVTRDITSPRVSGRYSEQESPSPSPRNSWALNMSNGGAALSLQHDASLHRAHRTSDLSMLSADLADMVHSCVPSCISPQFPLTLRQATQFSGADRRPRPPRYRSNIGLEQYVPTCYAIILGVY
jgi:hypothetical protein